MNETGKTRIPDPVRLVIGVISSSPGHFEKASRVLEACFGEKSSEFGPIAFDFTDYYDKEMGPCLERRLLVFPGLYSLENLHFAKVLTNDIENRTSEAPGMRTVNLDPGYLTPAKLVLYTTKDFVHRVYIGDGIFGESTLQYRDGDYRETQTTYADFRTRGIRDFFISERKGLLEDLKLVSSGAMEPIDFMHLMHH